MEGELIYVAIIMQIGTIIAIMVWSNVSLRKYFAKENFKTGLSNVRAENKLNLKKLEKDLGLTGGINPLPPSKDHSPIDKLGLLSQLAPVLAKLDGEQITALIEKLVTGEEVLSDEGGGGGLLDNIPPELIESFLKGLQKGNVTGEGGEASELPDEGFTGQV